MTLVLPIGPDQIATNPLFAGSSTVRKSSMPCVFDGEPLDFESALMSDWTSEMNDYDTPADDFSMKTPSETNELKRKASGNEDEASSNQSKKSRTDDDVDLSSPLQSGIVSSSSSQSSSPASDFLPPSLDVTSSNEDADMEEEEYLPRRRGPQMWNSRQRWKDERKKVLKMSISKLAEIEDPELCLRKSVAINNTIKRLHMDIRNERQTKYRSRQQHLFQPAFFQEGPRASELYDDASCDEIFGDDFLRAAAPDRRVSSPIPDSSREKDTVVEVPRAAYVNPSSSCDSAVDCASTYCPRRTTPVPTTQSPAPSLQQRRLVGSAGGQQCATQYRTNRESGSDGSFPPRVPILDSVVYHSLLASLESS